MSRSRALVLGSGGLTGAAWQLGVLGGLESVGSFPDGADLVVGTSAGALLAAHLLTGDTPDTLLARLRALPPAPSMGWDVPARLLAAQLWPSRRHAVVALGAWAASLPRPEGTAWLRAATAALRGRPWPDELQVVATDVASGRPAFLTATSGVGLAEAVAASCALPGVLPPVRVGPRLLFDGGLRSQANLDLAEPADVVLALAPLSAAVSRVRRPREQALHLPGEVLLLEPDRGERRAIGLAVMDAAGAEPAHAAGFARGRAAGAVVAAAWR